MPSDERWPLWADIRRLSSTVSLPWLLMEDLNTTLFHDERVEGGVIVPSEIEELSSVLEDIEVMDMKFSGQRLTWCNNQEAENKMYCKLDRVLVNKEWFYIFPMAETFFLDRSSSDHCPSIVRMFNDSPKGKHVFRYCNFWSKDDNFLSFVQQAWNTEVQGTPMYVLV